VSATRAKRHRNVPLTNWRFGVSSLPTPKLRLDYKLCFLPRIRGTAKNHFPPGQQSGNLLRVIFQIFKCLLLEAENIFKLAVFVEDPCAEINNKKIKRGNAWILFQQVKYISYRY